MLIIYFLLGLGMTTAHSDYGVSFRAQNFDKTGQNIDKEAYVNHQREKRHITGYFVPQNVTNRPSWGSNINRDFVANISRFQYENRPSRYNGVIPNTDTEGIPNTDTEGVIPNTDTEGVIPNTDTEGVIPNTDTEGVIPNTDTEEAPNYQRVKRFVTGYFVPQNITNKPTWGNFTITRNNMTYTTPANTITNLEQNSLNTRPNNNATVTYIYPGQPGYVNPLQNTNVTRPVNPYYIYVRGRNTSGYIKVPVNPATPGHTLYPGYNATGPVNPKPNNIIVRPANNNNVSNSNASGYNIQPVNPVTPGNRPYYPVPNTGYPASSTGNPVPNTGYPASNTVYPAGSNWYPAPNTVYPASNTGNLAPNTGYRAPNTVYPVPNTGYPASNTLYPAPGIVYPAPNNAYPVPNTGYPATNTQYTNTGYPSTSGYPIPSPGVTIYDAGYRNNSSGFNNNENGFNITTSLANCNCKLPRANSTITKEETTTDACMIACNKCPAGKKMSPFGVCVKDLDYDY